MNSITEIGTAGLAAVEALATGLAGVLLAYAGIKWGFAGGKWVIAKIGSLFSR
jgi:hypothetical protein